MPGTLLLDASADTTVQLTHVGTEYTIGTLLLDTSVDTVQLTHVGTEYMPGTLLLDASVDTVQLLSLIHI